MAEGDLRERIVDAADRLFYDRSVAAVGMDSVRDESGASLKAIYREFPSKEDLVLAVLERRHDRWTAGVEATVGRIEDPRERVLAVYDYLSDWFDQAGFRGCGFINTFGELGASSPRVAEAVRRHKRSFQDYVERLVLQAGGGAALGAQLAILAEGAQTTAAIAGVPDAAVAAREAARVLITAELGAVVEV